MYKSVILSKAQLDIRCWEELINECGGSLFNTYEYLCSSGEEWEALIFIHESKYICATPVHFRAKYGFKYIYQSPYVPYYEILNSHEPEVGELLKQELVNYLGQHKYVARFFLRSDTLLKSKKLKIFYNHGYQLSLRNDYESIRKSYSQDRKYRLNQATKSGQEIIQIKDLNLFFIHLEKYTICKIENFEKGQIEVLRNLYQQLTKKYNTEIYISKKENEIYSGILIIKHLSAIYYLESFNSEAGRKYGGTTLLLDHVIKANANSNYEIIDLGLKGTIGIESYKASFGAEKYEVVQVHKNELPWYVKVIKAILNYFGTAVSKF